MKKEISFLIDEDLVEKFEAAILVNKENLNKVLSKWMIQYVSSSFSKAESEKASQPSIKSNNLVKVGSNFSNNQIETKKLDNRISKKITKEMIEIAYNFAKKVYFGELTRTEGKQKISTFTGMNAGSAQDYITDFLAMMSGQEYHRTMSNFGTEYYLENIRKDFGNQAFMLALEATEKHIKYYNALGYGQLKEKEKIVRKFKETIR
ncbi:hypothetical protein [Ferdinandcohnia sp. Marseille-Q9671]